MVYLCAHLNGAGRPRSACHSDCDYTHGDTLTRPSAISGMESRHFCWRDNSFYDGNEHDDGLQPQVSTRSCYPVDHVPWPFAFPCRVGLDTVVRSVARRVLSCIEQVRPLGDQGAHVGVVERQLVRNAPHGARRVWPRLSCKRRVVEPSLLDPAK